ncbi:MAG: hypothetical protein ABIE92_03500 [bacterium]
MRFMPATASKYFRCASGVIFSLFCFLPLSANLSPSACTIAMVRGSATIDGRPLMMKTRDRSDFDQDFIYGAEGLYAYIGTSGAGITNKIYGGVNEVGFAIINSNAYNFPDTVSGWADDGYIMKLALETCRTVYDFQYILDSTNTPGRTLPATYGVMDAYGNGIFYEATAGSYFICDWDDSTYAPNGYMVRSTFAYNGGPEHEAQFRHDRALALLDSGYAEGILSRQYLAQTVLRDLVNSEADPYPLPFQGMTPSSPYGFLHTYTEDMINRATTRAVVIIQGIEAGGDPGLATLWAMAGQPVTTVALPLWVHAGSVPDEFNGLGYNQSALNSRSEEYRNYLYSLGWPYYKLDTWRLVDQWGGGLLPYLIELEDELTARGDSAWAVWEATGLPSTGEIADFQNELAATALADLTQWGPAQTPEVRLEILPGDRILLDWELVQFNVFERPLEVSHYTIYGSSEPFLDRLTGDSLTTVDAPPVTLPMLDVLRFYQVRCGTD